MKAKKALKRIGKAEQLLIAVRDELVDCPDPVRTMLEEAAIAVETIGAELAGANGKPAQKERKTHKHPAAPVRRRRAAKAAGEESTQ